MSLEVQHDQQVRTAADIEERSASLRDRVPLSSSHWCLLIYCTVAPLSIALSQIFAVLAILCWLREGWQGRASPESKLPTLTPTAALLAKLSVLWLLVSLIAALAGVSTAHAVREMLKSGFYMLLPFCVYSTLAATVGIENEFVRRLQYYFTALAGGQAIAALHTWAGETLDYRITPHLPGPVTESGQLVLVIPCLLSLALLNPKLRANGIRQIETKAVLALIVFLSLLAIAWPEMTTWLVKHTTPWSMLFFALTAAAGIWILVAPPKRLREWFPAKPSGLLYLGAVLLFLALLLNLKRGPWLGVFVELLIIAFFLSRRLFSVTLLLVVLLFVLPPARNRIARGAADFEISGGRKNMWALGVELTERFPLGLGLDNAAYMRLLDHTLPVRHRHMHNNLLNVTVENGWLGLAVFVAWIGGIITAAFKLSRRLRRASIPYCRQLGKVSLLLGAGLVGWQVAGVVEYNFGDGEVRMIAFFMMGVVLAISSVAERCAEREGPLALS